MLGMYFGAACVVQSPKSIRQVRQGPYPQISQITQIRKTAGSIRQALGSRRADGSILV